MKPINLLAKLLLLMPLTVPAQVTTPVMDSVAAENAISSFKLKKQPRFFISVYGGYSLALGSTFKFYPDDVSSISVKMVENIPASKKVSYAAPTKGLGEGFRIGAGLSYIVNDFINVGIDVSYLNTSISKNRDSSFYQVQEASDVNYDYKEQYKISYNAKLVTISPNITFKAISRPRFFIYNKIGAILTFRPNSIQTEQQDVNVKMGWQGFFKDSSAVNSRRYEWGIRNPAFGFMGGIGTQVRIQERIRVFGELQFTHVVFAVRNRVLTNYTVDGKEMVSTLPVSQKQIDFEKNYVADEWNTNPNKPVVATRQRFPISYIGFQTGLAYRF
jgi:hypothetical protein